MQLDLACLRKQLVQNVYLCTLFSSFSFGQVELSSKSTCAFVASNLGRFNVDVQYEITGPEELQCHLQVEPKTAMVPVGQQNYCILSFLPLKKCDLKDMGFLIKAFSFFSLFYIFNCEFTFICEVL